MTTSVSRSVYVAQLHRAFLMRAHPDRFRKYSPSIRKGQGHLIQALGERMNAADFQGYIANSSTADSSFHIPKQPIPFVLERRDGSLLEQKIQLSDSVENVLKSLVNALELSGATSLAPPPPAPKQVKGNFGPSRDEMLWASDSSSETIDHRFNVNSNRGRDLMAFLNSVSTRQIEERRMARMDATAAALVARRLYHFQAIDGIRMGWSSDSFAILLKSLIRLHDEHSSRFHVESFYPLRLHFSSDDSTTAFDMYGGNLYLKPAATQLEWLEALQEVTEERLADFHANRSRRDENLNLIQNAFGVKFSKGFSCSSKDYHYFAQRIAEHLPQTADTNSNNSQALEIERIRIVVEAPEACRRPRATKEGSIRVNSRMSEQEITAAILRLQQSAKENLEEERVNRLKCKEAISQSQWALGLQKVSRIGIVGHSDFLSSLARLIDQSSSLAGALAGRSVGITGTGHFCHLGDDGSLVLPHDWT